MKRLKELWISIIILVVFVAGLIFSVVILAKKDSNDPATVATRMNTLAQGTSKRIQELNNALANGYNKTIGSSDSYSFVGDENEISTYSVHYGNGSLTSALSWLTDDYTVWTISEYVNEFKLYDWLDKVFELTDMGVEHWYCKVSLTNNALTYDDNRTVDGNVIIQDHVKLTYDFEANKPLTMNTRYISASGYDYYLQESSIDFVAGTYKVFSVNLDKDIDFNLILNKNTEHFKSHFRYGTYISLNFFDASNYEYFNLSLDSADDFNNINEEDAQFIFNAYDSINLVDPSQTLDFENAPVFPQSGEAYRYCTTKYKMEVDENGRIVVGQATGIDPLIIDGIDFLNSVVSNGLVENSATIGKSLVNDGTDYREKIFAPKNSFMLNNNEMLKTINEFYENEYDSNKTYYKAETYKGYDFLINGNELIIKRDYGDKIELMIVDARWWSVTRFAHISYFLSDANGTRVADLEKFPYGHYDNSGNAVIDYNGYYFDAKHYDITYQTFKNALTSSDAIFGEKEYTYYEHIYVSEGSNELYYRYITLNEEKKEVNIKINFEYELEYESYITDHYFNGSSYDSEFDEIKNALKEF